MKNKMALFTLVIVLLLGACSPATIAPTALPTMDNTKMAAMPTPTVAATMAPMTKLKIVASTSWVGAFAKAAGAEDITVIAPSNIQHPPDYDPKPSDLAAVSQSDYILMAGFEGFAKRLQEAVGGDSKKLITVNTENSPEAIHKEVTRLGELFGTQTKAKAFLDAFDAEYAKLSSEVKGKLGSSKPTVVAQAFVVPWAVFAGLEVSGTYGPMPLKPDELKALADKKPTIVFENWHMGGGQPVVEATGAKKIDLINFPGDDLDLMAVFHTNTTRLEEAFGSTSSPNYPVTIQNCGRTLTFTNAPERIVTTYPNVAELLIRLGVGDRIVGSMYHKDTPVSAEVADAFNRISKQFEKYPAKEELVSLKADFALAAYDSFDFSGQNGMPTIDEANGFGLPVYGISTECGGGVKTSATLSMIYTDVLNLGKIFGVSTQAQQIVDEMKGRVAIVQQKVAGKTPLKATIYYGGEGPLGVFTNGIYADLLQLAGGTTVFPDEKQNSAEVSVEVFANRNPDVIFVIEYGTPFEKMRDYLRKTFPNTNAVKNDRIVLVDAGTFPPGFRNIEAVEAFAKAMHPEAFK